MLKRPFFLNRSHQILATDPCTTWSITMPSTMRQDNEQQSRSPGLSDERVHH